MTPNNKNKNLITKLQDELSSISMTADEKLSVRHELEQSLTETNSSKADNKAVPWVRHVQQVPRYFARTAVGFAAVLFMLGGLTYAAEGSLPGTPLYTVKKHVNEAFISITSFSNSKSAETQSKLAARRINELQALVNKGRLTTTTSEELLNDIAAHTKLARKSIAELEAAGEKKRRQAKKLSSQLNALLAAESESLQSVTTATTSGQASENELVQQAARELITIASENSEESTVADTDQNLTKSAMTDLLTLAVGRLQEVYDMYRGRENTNSTPPPQNLVTAAHDLESALNSIKSTDYEKAVSSLRALLAQTRQAREKIARKASGSTASDVPSTSLNQAIESNGIKEVVQENNPTSSSTTTALSDTVSSSTSTDAGSSSEKSSATGLSSVPSKQNLHNEAIRDAIKEARAYLQDLQAAEESGRTTEMGSSTQMSSDDKASKVGSTTTSSTVGTSTSDSTATSSGSQRGDDTKP